MDSICWGPDKPLTSKTEVSATRFINRSGRKGRLSLDTALQYGTEDVMDRRA
jgi:hypothetical protein